MMYWTKLRTGGLFGLFWVHQFGPLKIIEQNSTRVVFFLGGFAAVRHIFSSYFLLVGFEHHLKWWFRFDLPEKMRLMEESRQDFDIYRCMAGSAVDTHAMDDDDIADLTGALKYVRTEILTEHLQSPIRQTRKYGIDVVTRHRIKFKNPSTVQKTPNALQGEFSQFVTYDFGKATNPAQMPIIKEQVPTSCQYWEGSGISGNISVVCLQNSVWNEIPFIQRKFRRLYFCVTEFRK